MKVYLDNAATTPISNEVLDAMIPVLREQFGNPSSIHAYGRETRSLIEKSRKTIATLLNVAPAEIFFTSGGTEANNTALRCSIEDLGITHAITTRIEHHAVLHTLEMMEKMGKVKLSFVNITKSGEVDLVHLEELLKDNPHSLVSLMHANNEIGALLPLDKVSELCLQHNAILHSDTVQTMGHYSIDLQKTKIHFVTCAAHKFHGPKGIGFLYINGDVKIKPLIYGGAQERNMRGGTENVYGIVGLAKAFEVAYRDLEKDKVHISSLKQLMRNRLTEEFPGVVFNGDPGSDSLFTVLNVSLPQTEMAEMMLFSLDIAGVAASGGSACSSGSEIGSHVLRAIGSDPGRPSVRFSFSKYNTVEEIEYTIDKIKELYAVKV